MTHKMQKLMTVFLPDMPHLSLRLSTQMALHLRVGLEYNQSDMALTPIQSSMLDRARFEPPSV